MIIWILGLAAALGQSAVLPSDSGRLAESSPATDTALAEPSLFNPYMQSARPLEQQYWTPRLQQPTGTGVQQLPAFPLQLEAGYGNQSPAPQAPQAMSAQSQMTHPPAPQPWNISMQRDGRMAKLLDHSSHMDQFRRPDSLSLQQRARRVREHMPHSLDLQIRGLVMMRDHATNQALTTDVADAIVLSTRDADMDNAGGVELTLGKTLEDDSRRIEMVYWGLFTAGDTASAADAASGLNTALNIDGLSYDGFGNPLSAVFDGSANHSLSRSFEYHNVEWNLTSTHRSEDGSQSVQLLIGFRYLKADDRFKLTVDDVGYSVSDDNHLFGIQIGGLGHWQKNEKLTYHAGVKTGLFCNAIDHRTQILGAAGYAFIEDPAIVNWRDDFNEYSNKNDISFLGQLEFGLDYILRDGCKFTAGYRIMGVTGMAFATDQIPASFAEAAMGQNVTADGSLILHGAYMGIDWNF